MPHTCQHKQVLLSKLKAAEVNTREDIRTRRYVVGGSSLRMFAVRFRLYTWMRSEKYVRESEDHTVALEVSSFYAWSSFATKG